jgi:ribose transport system permease protein
MSSSRLQARRTPPVGTRFWRSLSLRQTLSFTNISALYILVLLVIVFGFWVPELFFSWETAASIFNENAVTLLMALSLVVPLAAGVFDLSIGQTMSLCSVFLAWCLGPQGMDPVVAVILTMGLALAVGIVNAIVVVGFKIDSFIGTLAVSSLLLAVVLVISNNQLITQGVASGIGEIAGARPWGVTLPVYLALFVTLILWYVLGHTALGRSVYATGLGPEAARLAGIATNKIRFSSLICSALIAGFSAVIVTARIGAGSPTVGPPYLIPAFAAAFLGATQFRGALFKPLGVLVAVVVLGTVSTGLSLAGVPPWMPYIFQGSVLIGALALAGFKSRPKVSVKSGLPSGESFSSSDENSDTKEFNAQLKEREG